jgi:predicted dehydrogenase
VLLAGRDCLPMIRLRETCNDFRLCNEMEKHCHNMKSQQSIHSLRAGVIGTGFIGPVHVEALRRLGVTVTAICDVADLGAKAAARLAIPEAFADYRELLASPEVDVVHITTPNRFHCAMALAALQAGKHVVCEKPLAMNTRETARIVQAARATKRLFAVNYNVRFYPAVLTLRRLVERGDLGDIIHVNGSYMQDWLFKETDYNWRLLPKEGGILRAVADIGTHWMDTVSFILSAGIQSVLADLATWHQTRKRPLGEVHTFAKANAKLKYATYPVQTDDFASVLLRFANGARGNLAVSQVAAGRKNCIRIEIYGSTKSAWWCSEEPEMLHFGNRDGANETAVRATPAFGDGAAGLMDYPPGHVEGFPDTFKMNFRAIYSAILDDKAVPPLFATAEDGHQEVAVCEAILKSNQARTWITV